MNLYNDLVRCEFDKSTTPEELKNIQNRADEAINDLMLGVSAVGSLMFWAADSGNYSEETAKDDMYRIGAMLGKIGEVARALIDTAANAGFSRSIFGKELKVRSAK